MASRQGVWGRRARIHNRAVQIPILSEKAVKREKRNNFRGKKDFDAAERTLSGHGDCILKENLIKRR